MSVDILDYWKDGEFEEAVAAALIACFESKIKKKKAPSSVRLGDDSLRNARIRGLYLPSNSRVIYDPLQSTVLDMVNDTLPDFGCLALRKPDNGIEDNYNGYIHLMSFAKIQELPKNFYARGRGTLYQMDYMTPSHDYVDGEKLYFTVSKDGNIRACSGLIDVAGKNGGRNTLVTQENREPHLLKQVEVNASMALQYISDKRFCWAITAKESVAKVTLGCMHEEIKSLLYARSLPMTETGRKRPILHLVESHKRRIKNGTDIDVTSFLRGQKTVEIGGTQFTVNPPKQIMPTLSKNSQKFADA